VLPPSALVVDKTKFSMCGERRTVPEWRLVAASGFMQLDWASSQHRTAFPHVRQCLPCGRSAICNCDPNATEANVHTAVEGIEQRLRELPDVNQVILAGLEVRA
jgi:hypothetical protein